jgi:hypothetical protein
LKKCETSIFTLSGRNCLSQHGAPAKIGHSQHGIAPFVLRGITNTAPVREDPWAPSWWGCLTAAGGSHFCSRQPMVGSLWATARPVISFLFVINFLEPFDRKSAPWLQIRLKKIGKEITEPVSWDCQGHHWACVSGGTRHQVVEHLRNLPVTEQRPCVDIQSTCISISHPVPVFTPHAMRGGRGPTSSMHACFHPSTALIIRIQFLNLKPSLLSYPISTHLIVHGCVSLFTHCSCLLPDRKTTSSHLASLLSSSISSLPSLCMWTKFHVHLHPPACYSRKVCTHCHPIRLPLIYLALILRRDLSFMSFVLLCHFLTEKCTHIIPSASLSSYSLPHLVCMWASFMFTFRALPACHLTESALRSSHPPHHSPHPILVHEFHVPPFVHCPSLPSCLRASHPIRLIHPPHPMCRWTLHIAAGSPSYLCMHY